MFVRVCVCSRNKQTRRSPKLRAKITLIHTYRDSLERGSGCWGGREEGKGEEAALLTLISQSRKDFCQIFARVLHVVAFGKSFPNTFCTFCELLLFLMWRACVTTFVFVFLPLCSFTVAFWHSDSLTLSHSHSHSHSLTHSGRHTADKLRDCQSCAQERKCKFR